MNQHKATAPNRELYATVHDEHTSTNQTYTRNNASHNASRRIAAAGSFLGRETTRQLRLSATHAARTTAGNVGIASGNNAKHSSRPSSAQSTKQSTLRKAVTRPSSAQPSRPRTGRPLVSTGPSPSFAHKILTEDRFAFGELQRTHLVHLTARREASVRDGYELCLRANQLERAAIELETEIAARKEKQNKLRCRLAARLQDNAERYQQQRVNAQWQRIDRHEEARKQWWHNGTVVDVDKDPLVDCDEMDDVLEHAKATSARINALSAQMRAENIARRALVQQQMQLLNEAAALRQATVDKYNPAVPDLASTRRSSMQHARFVRGLARDRVHGRPRSAGRPRPRTAGTTQSSFGRPQSARTTDRARQASLGSASHSRRPPGLSISSATTRASSPAGQEATPPAPTDPASVPPPRLFADDIYAQPIEPVDNSGDNEHNFRPGQGPSSTPGGVSDSNVTHMSSQASAASASAHEAFPRSITLATSPTVQSPTNRSADPLARFRLPTPGSLSPSSPGQSTTVRPGLASSPGSSTVDYDESFESESDRGTAAGSPGPRAETGASLLMEPGETADDSELSIAPPPELQLQPNTSANTAEAEQSDGSGLAPALLCIDSGADVAQVRVRPLRETVEAWAAGACDQAGEAGLAKRAMWGMGWWAPPHLEPTPSHSTDDAAAQQGSAVADPLTSYFRYTPAPGCSLFVSARVPIPVQSQRVSRELRLIGYAVMLAPETVPSLRSQQQRWQALRRAGEGAGPRLPRSLMKQPTGSFVSLALWKDAILYMFPSTKARERLFRPTSEAFAEPTSSVPVTPAVDPVGFIDLDTVVAVEEVLVPWKPVMTFGGLDRIVTMTHANQQPQTLQAAILLTTVTGQELCLYIDRVAYCTEYEQTLRRRRADLATATQDRRSALTEVAAAVQRARSAESGDIDVALGVNDAEDLVKAAKGRLRATSNRVEALRSEIDHLTASGSAQIEQGHRMWLETLGQAVRSRTTAIAHLTGDSEARSNLDHVRWWKVQVAYRAVAWLLHSAKLNTSTNPERNSSGRQEMQRFEASAEATRVQQWLRKAYPAFINGECCVCLE